MQGLRIQGNDCPYNPRAFPSLHTKVQMPRSTGQGLLLQSFCVPAIAHGRAGAAKHMECARAAIHGGQICESAIPGGRMPKPRAAPGAAADLRQSAALRSTLRPSASTLNLWLLNDMSGVGTALRSKPGPE